MRKSDDTVDRPSEVDDTVSGSQKAPKRSLKSFLVPKNIGDLLAIIVPVVAFSIAPHFYSNEILLITMMVYVALAQGVNVIYGLTGYLPFGYVGFYGVGAYATSLAILDIHVAPEIAIVIGGVVSALLALVLMPLLKLSGSYFAIATLAAAEALYALVANPSLKSITQGPYGINIGAVYSSGGSYVVAVVLVGLSILTFVAVKRSRLGLALRAIRNDPVSASLSGVNVVLERTKAWLVAAAIAGLAGGVFAWTITIFYPSAVFDISISVFAIVFALFGGVGTTFGPVVGAVVLYGLYSYVGVTQPQYFQLIFGVIIVIFVLFLPKGVAGVAGGLIRRVRLMKTRGEV